MTGMDNEKDDVIVRLNWLSQNFANKKKIWVKRSKKDFADKVFSICTDALGLLIEQRAEIERLKEMNQELVRLNGMDV